jgi:hypothetical protein
MIATMTEPTWADLTSLEPRLAGMSAEIQAITDDGESRCFCADEIWSERFKPELCQLVGFFRRPGHPVLSTSFAYDTAFEKLRGAFPPCRNCCCL